MELIVNWITDNSIIIIIISIIILIISLIFTFASGKINKGSLIVSVLSIVVTVISTSFSIKDYNDSTSYFFYDKASKEFISDEYFEYNMSYEDVQLAINEFYAVYGNIFDNQSLQNYFLSKKWYIPKNKINNLTVCLENEYESYNYEKLLEYRDKKKNNINTTN